jgi:hypothetical protein
LNVALVQKLCASRYQAWYVRTQGCVNWRRWEIGTSCARKPYVEEPPAFVRTASRTIEPQAQRNPSPKTVPAPPFTGAVPWKYMHDEFAIASPGGHPILLGTQRD